MMSSPRPPHDQASIDWPAIRARLAEAMAATSEWMSASSERTRLVLEERARRLAQPALAARPAGPQMNVLTFSLREETYALETRFVLAVAPVPPVARVPASPAHLAGLVAWRGYVVAAIQLDALFAPRASGTSTSPRLVVLGEEQPQLGLLIDPPFEVRRCSAHVTSSSMTWTDSPLGEHVRGIIADQMLCLDGRSLLQDRRFNFGE